LLIQTAKALILVFCLHSFHFRFIKPTKPPRNLTIATINEKYKWPLSISCILAHLCFQFYYAPMTPRQSKYTLLKVKVLNWHQWFHEERLTYMEPFHCTSFL